MEYDVNSDAMPEHAKKELFAVLNALPTEVPALKKALINGTFEGSVYSDGRNACLKGTVCKANIKKIMKFTEADQRVEVVTSTGRFIVDAGSPLEVYVFPIGVYHDAMSDRRRAFLLEAIVEWEVKHSKRALARYVTVPKKERSLVTLTGLPR